MSNNGILQAKNTKYLPANTTTYNVTQDDDFIYVDTSLNAVEIILPNIRNGALTENPKCFKINDYSGNANVNNITIKGCGGDSVNSAVSFVMQNAYESVETNVVNLDEWFCSSSAGNTPVTGFVPYTGATQNVNLGLFSISTASIAITGTAGAGFASFARQTSAPSTPVTGFRLYGGGSNTVNWVSPNGFSTILDSTANSADRTYTFPDANGTIALTSSLSGYVPYTGATQDVDLGTFSLTTPLLIGGAGVGSVIQYKGTTANGTSTVAAHQFLVGNNGATTAMSVYNSGQVLFNGSTLPGGSLSQVRITKGTGVIDFGEYASGRGAIWFNNSTPTLSNFNVSADATGVHGYLNGSSSSRMLAAGNIVFSVFPTQITAAPSAATGSNVNFDFTTPANTSRTASTNVPNFRITGNTVTWNPGALTTQYFNYISANTIAFGSASTATSVYGLYVEAATAGTNATITNNYAIGADGRSIFGVAIIGTWAQSASYFVLRHSSASDASGYAIVQDNTGLTTLNGANTLNMATSGTTRFQINDNSSVSTVHFDFTPRARGTLTASAEVPIWRFGSQSTQWATGAITTQRFTYLPTQTITFSGSSTVTNAYGLYVEAATAGSNATITNNYAAGFNSTIEVPSIIGGSATNHTLTFKNTTGTQTSIGTCYTFSTGDNHVLLTMAYKTITFAPSSGGSGSSSSIVYSVGSNTGQTASTEINGFSYNSYARTWAAGAITTQREHYIRTTTYAFASSSTITNAYAWYAEAPTAGSNATITNNYAAGFAGGVLFTDGTTLRIGQATSQIGLSFTGSLALSDFALWGTSTNTVLNTPQTLTIRVGNATQATINNTTWTLSPSGTASSGTSTAFTWSAPNNTGQTASTEIQGFLYNSYTRTWAAGAITTQREHYIKTVTYAFASSSTITNAYGLYVEAATAGTNATITNNFSIGWANGSDIGRLGSAASGLASIWLRIASPASTNYTLSGDGTNTFLNSPSGGSVQIRVGTTAQLNLTLNAFTFSDSVNMVFDTTTGTKIGTATTQKIGFWNATPIVQPASTGTTTAGFTANASANAVYAESTFTGNTGATAYTISDIVRNMKNAGSLAA